MLYITNHYRNGKLKTIMTYHLTPICYCCCLIAKSCLTLSLPNGLQPVRILCRWDFPGKNTGMGCHFLLQGSNSHLLHQSIGGQVGLYHWATRETLTPIRMTTERRKKKKTEKKSQKDIEKSELLRTVRRNVNWCYHCGKQDRGSSKRLKNRTTK